MSASQVSPVRLLLPPVTLAIVFRLSHSPSMLGGNDVGVFTSSSRDVCLTLFGAGFGSDTYSTIQAGFQLEQALLYVSAVGRVTAYQVYRERDATVVDRFR